MTDSVPTDSVPLEPLVAECDGCGDDIVEGTPHDCPVLGTTVTISRKEKP